jgi:hypothetical protein
MMHKSAHMFKIRMLFRPKTGEGEHDEPGGQNEEITRRSRAL